MFNAKLTLILMSQPFSIQYDRIKVLDKTIIFGPICNNLKSEKLENHTV